MHRHMARGTFFAVPAAAHSVPHLTPLAQFHHQHHILTVLICPIQICHIQGSTCANINLLPQKHVALHCICCPAAKGPKQCGTSTCNGVSPCIECFAMHCSHAWHRVYCSAHNAAAVVHPWQARICVDVHQLGKTFGFGILLCAHNTLWTNGVGLPIWL